LKKGDLWPAKEICNALVSHGLAMRNAPILNRVKAVPKSSTAAPGHRPTPADHIKTIETASHQELGFKEITRITLVDDLITKGSTSIAAATHLKHNFPNAEVQVFALIRTNGLKPEIDKIMEPIIGTVSLHGSDANRHP